MPERAASLNYHHLLYFWLTAREGSISAAAARLQLSPSTLSAQIRMLEDALGEPLFDRHGRRLVLTGRGQLVLRYADRIFGLGSELVDVLRRDGPSTLPLRIAVGVDYTLPKILVSRLLEPLFELRGDVRVAVRQGDASALFAELAVHRLDAVLSSSPGGQRPDAPIESSVLAEVGVTLAASPERAAALTDGFPHSLGGQPLLLPSAGSALRALLDDWIARHTLTPRVIGEFDDATLMKSLGARGFGVFPVLSPALAQVETQLGAVPIGDVDGPPLRVHLTSRADRLDRLVTDTIAGRGISEKSKS